MKTSPAKIEVVTIGERNRSNGTAGCGERRSIARKATVAVAASAAATIAAGSPTPRSPASITAKVSAPTATIAATCPGTSSGVRRRGERGACVVASTATIPTGTLT